MFSLSIYPFVRSWVELRVVSCRVVVSNGFVFDYSCLGWWFVVVGDGWIGSDLLAIFHWRFCCAEDLWIQSAVQNRCFILVEGRPLSSKIWKFENGENLYCNAFMKRKPALQSLRYLVMLVTQVNTVRVCIDSRDRWVGGVHHRIILFLHVFNLAVLMNDSMLDIV